MAHTPEPWCMPDTDRPTVCAGPKHGPRNGLIATLDAGDYARSRTEGLANAARIVACVNACAGIPTDKLRPGIVRELIDTAQVFAHDDSHDAQRKMIALLRELGSE